MEKPTQVERAVAMLWLSLAIYAIDTIVWVVPYYGEDPSFVLFMAIFMTITFSFNGFFIYQADHRKNWARVLLFIWATGNVVACLIWPPDSTFQDWLSWVPVIAATILEVWALALLFTGSGSVWYSREVAA